MAVARSGCSRYMYSAESTSLPSTTQLTRRRTARERRRTARSAPSTARLSCVRNCVGASLARGLRLSAMDVSSHLTMRSFRPPSTPPPQECAHAITQLGLRNMSGTDGQTTGAVHGEGVYLGMRKHVASSFAPVSAASALGAAWPGAALRGADLTVVFAADVVDDASFRQATISIRDEDGGSARDSYLVVRDAARNVRVQVRVVVILLFATLLCDLFGMRDCAFRAHSAALLLRNRRNPNLRAQRLFLGAALPRAAGRGRSAPDGAARGTSAANSGGSTALAQREGAAGTQRAPARAGAGAGAPGNRVKRLVRWIALFVLTTGGAVAVLLIALLAV